MTHSKSSTELFGTSGPSNPRLENYGRQLIGPFGTEVVIGVSRCIQNLTVRTKSVITACHDPRAASFRNNNGWSDLPFLVEQDSILIVVFSIVLIPHVLNRTIPIFVDMRE